MLPISRIIIGCTLNAFCCLPLFYLFLILEVLPILSSISRCILKRLDLQLEMIVYIWITIISSSPLILWLDSIIFSLWFLLLNHVLNRPWYGSARMIMMVISELALDEERDTDSRKMGGAEKWIRKVEQVGFEPQYSSPSIARFPFR